MLKKTERSRRIIVRAGCLLLTVLIATTLVLSWGSTGHHIINLKAAMHLPSSMASWKADSLFYYNHASDADGRKVYTDTSFFAEAQRHYIDIDWYPNYHQLPHALDSMFMLYGRYTVWDNGTQPWAEVMVLDSLTAQFARNDISKAKQTMADLGHYVADAHQPLHCTRNYDGQYTGNNGIHSRYETSMINTYQSALTITLDSAQYIAKPLDYIFDFIYKSNSYVDSIMAADTYAKAASGWNGSGTPPASYYTALWEKTQGFTKQRFQDATVALASLWYTAWVNSQLPPPIVYDTITATKFGLGALFPSGTVIVEQGHDTSFTFSPDVGYHLDSVKIDGVLVDSLTSYTFQNISSSHTLKVWFGVNKYLIDVVSGQHGTISPAGVCVANYGETKSFVITPDADYLIDSVVADGVRVDSLGSFTFTNIMEDHSLSAAFKKHIVSLLCSVVEDWNLVSVPLRVDDMQTTTLFPAAISRAFEFQGSYVSGDSMAVGVGYWLRFLAPVVWSMDGTPMTTETLVVHQGWNLIGALSFPIAVSSITSNPQNMSTSDFFEYAGTYNMTDSLRPTKGYWVRVDQEGTLILSASAVANASARISIVRNVEEMPPPPPSGRAQTSFHPKEYALEQAFPNPFNPSTTIQYELPNNCKVVIEIFDLVGKKVVTLVDATQSAGYKSVQWNASAMGSGMYFCRLQAVAQTNPTLTIARVQKLMLIK